MESERDASPSRRGSHKVPTQAILRTYPGMDVGFLMCYLMFALGMDERIRAALWLHSLSDWRLKCVQKMLSRRVRELVLAEGWCTAYKTEKDSWYSPDPTSGQLIGCSIQIVADGVEVFAFGSSDVSFCTAYWRDKEGLGGEVAYFMNSYGRVEHLGEGYKGQDVWFHQLKWYCISYVLVGRLKVILDENGWVSNDGSLWFNWNKSRELVVNIDWQLASSSWLIFQFLMLVPAYNIPSTRIVPAFHSFKVDLGLDGRTVYLKTSQLSEVDQIVASREEWFVAVRAAVVEATP